MSYLNVSVIDLNHAGDETLKRYIRSSSYGNVIKHVIDIEIQDPSVLGSNNELSRKKFNELCDNLGETAMLYMESLGFDVFDNYGSPNNSEKSYSYYIWFYPYRKGRPTSDKHVVIMNMRISNHPDNNYAGHLNRIKKVAKKQSTPSQKVHGVPPMNISIKHRTYEDIYKALDSIIYKLDNLDPNNLLAKEKKRHPKDF